MNQPYFDSLVQEREGKFVDWKGFMEREMERDLCFSYFLWNYNKFIVFTLEVYLLLNKNGG